MPEEVNKEGYEVYNMIRSAADIMEQAVNSDNPTTKKALRDAAKALIAEGVARMDESVGESIEDEDE